MTFKKKKKKQKRRGHKHKTKGNHPTKRKRERNKGDTQNQLENKVYNGNKYIFINTYLTFQWTGCSNQKDIEW